MKRTTLALIAFAVAGFTSTLSAAIINGNSQTGFGGPIGGGSLGITDDGTNITFTLNRGTGGALNDSFVIYFDSTTGGATSLGTSGDIGAVFEGRRAIVNEFGSSISGFASGFASDYAFTLKVNGSVSNHLFTTPSGANGNSLGFVSTHSVSNFGNTTASSYVWTIPVTSIGLTANSGATFKIATTYLNAVSGAGSDASFRSNESIGSNNPGGSNPGFANYAFTGLNSYTIVPEPTSVALLGASALGSMFMMRRRRN